MQSIAYTEPSQRAACEPARFQHDNLALLRFAHDFAQHYRLDMGAVVDQLCAVPQTFLDLAHDPCGLTALASMIAGELGSEVSAPYVVAVH